MAAATAAALDVMVMAGPGRGAMAFFPGRAAKVPSFVGLGAPNTRLPAGGAVAEAPAPMIALVVLEVVEEEMGAEAACSAGMEREEELVVVAVEEEEEEGSVAELAVAAATAAAEAAAAAAAAAVAAALLFATEEAVGIE